MNIIEKLKQNAASVELLQGMPKDMDEAAKMIDALLGVLDCFGAMEGVWFEHCWEDYGITEEMHKKILAEYEAYEERKQVKASKINTAE